MADITVRAIGAKGVDLDNDPLVLDDAALRDSQNLYQETSRGRTSGLRQRPGYARFSLAMSGAILGGLGMPVKQVARATGAGGGPGTGGSGPSGTGPGDGGPPGGGSGPTGSGPFGSGPFGGARLIVIGRGTFSTVNSKGDSWFMNSENWADTAQVNSGPASGTGPNVHFYSPTNPGPPQIAAGPAGVVRDGYLYYVAGLNSQTGNQRPTIRRTNGFIDEKVVTVPRNNVGSGTQQVINAMHAGEDGNIWFTEMTTGTSNKSRLFKLDPDTKTLTNIDLITSNANPEVGASGSAVYVMASYNGRIVVGTHANAATGTASLIPVIPTASGGNYDAGVGVFVFNSPEANIGSIYNFDQTLYVGTGLATTTGATGSSNIYQMSISATGTWTATSVVTGSATGASGNYFPSMIAYKGKLYASYYNPAITALIYQFDGTTWTGVFTGPTGTARRWFLFVDKDTMYAIAPGNDTTGAPAYMTTTDGTSWTSKTANFPSGNSVHATPLLFGFEQNQ